MSSFHTNFRDLLNTSRSHSLLGDSSIIRRGKVCAIDLIEAIFDVGTLGVWDGHEVSLAEATEVVDGNWLLAPEWIWLFLNICKLTASTSSTMPRRTLFLYSSKICRSMRTSISGSSLKLMKVCLGTSGTRLFGRAYERLRRDCSGLICWLWSRR